MNSETINRKSIKINMVLNALKGILNVLFPLITFPYIAKVLRVDNIGKYNFSNSIISYFILFAGLGINTYAIREGARIREKTNEFNEFADEMFSLNISSTIVSYIVFFILLFTVNHFSDYRTLLAILSLQIAFKTIGIEWLYSVYEDYLYITVRSILFQLLSLVFLFLFVKNENDLNTYAGITVFSSVGSNILNLIHSRKYIRIRIKIPYKWKTHIKPILFLFAMAVAVTVYVASDTTMLGLLCDDYTVGIYSVSTKVYTIVKTILSSVLIVSIPRLSSLIGNNKQEEFYEVATDILGTLYTVLLPAITGIIVLRKEVVLLISSNEFISATSSLTILSVALFFCLGAWFWGQCILVPLKLDKDVFKITVVSAVVNIVLNLFLIPIMKENAAALTTLVAEGIAFGWCWIKGKKNVSIKGSTSVLLKSIIGCGAIVLVIHIAGRLLSNMVLFIILSIIASVFTYIVVELILKNQCATSVASGIKNRLFKTGVNYS